jgi:N-[(2S)-2-amino-2-carboxyethyl]-L-glutamate dehydrogenase
MRILSRDDVLAALDGHELAVLNAVRSAYLLHSEGQSAIPFSTFLRPPDQPNARIICLPAYLGGHEPVIGVKWISSFPDNLHRGLQRASSLMILNDLDTGYPAALLESSQISASRTAASAALASHFLHSGDEVHTVGLIGCGTINQRTIAYLHLVHPEIREVVLHDAVPEHAEVFAARLRDQHPHISFAVGDLAETLRRAETVSIATTDSTYWLDLADFPDRPADQVILHLSLRDLSTSSILRAYNVVDDVDHVCREQTSLHRAEQELGHRAFIHATLGGLIGHVPNACPEGATTIFSPFGLGILDLAVAAEVLRSADLAGIGMSFDGFDPGHHYVTSQLMEVRHG